VFFSLNATLVRWHTSWMTSCDAYFHFSVSTRAWMQAAAPAATGSNFPAKLWRQTTSSNALTYFLHNVISAMSLSAIDLILHIPHTEAIVVTRTVAMDFIQFFIVHVPLADLIDYAKSHLKSRSNKIHERVKWHHFLTGTLWRSSVAESIVVQILIM
jgi:hypothetical protein